MTTKTTKTEAQIARTEARDDAGRFYKNPCECCKKGAPVSAYYSDERCNTHGFGLVLCRRCAVKLEKVSDAEYAALAAEARRADLKDRARHLARQLGSMREGGSETDRAALRAELAKVEAALAAL